MVSSLVLAKGSTYCGRNTPAICASKHDRMLTVDAGGGHRLAAGDDFCAECNGRLPYRGTSSVASVCPGFVRLIGFLASGFADAVFQNPPGKGIPPVGAVPPLGFLIERQLGAAVETVEADFIAIPPPPLEKEFEISIPHLPGTKRESPGDFADC